jgi:hypothetical protein
MDIIINKRQTLTRPQAASLRGFGAAPAKKADVQAKAQSVLNLILSLQAAVKQYNAALKKVDPWWAQNFETQLTTFYTFRDYIDTLEEGTAELQTADNALDATRWEYEKLKKTLAGVKPGGGGTSTPPPAAEPESKTSPMLIVAGVLAGLAVIALVAGDR